MTDKVPDHGIVGEALIALKHDELKEMGIASVGHRLTILKQVYELKVEQDIPVEPDDYVPLCECLPSCYAEAPANDAQPQSKTPDLRWPRKRTLLG